MRLRPLIVVPILLAALAFTWALRVRNAPEDLHSAAAGARSETQERAAHAPEARSSTDRASTRAGREAARPPHVTGPHAPFDSGTRSDPVAPIDAADRARFNDQAREFFARASALSAQERRVEARRLERELERLERAGGLSAGETFLLRAGLIRETTSDRSEQAARIRALRERYESEARHRMAKAGTRSDPAFELYKVRENEIVAEVMSMQTIPGGLSRDEYLRRRLQAAREQLTP